MKYPMGTILEIRVDQEVFGGIRPNGVFIGIVSAFTSDLYVKVAWVAGGPHYSPMNYPPIIKERLVKERYDYICHINDVVNVLGEIENDTQGKSSEPVAHVPTESRDHSHSQLG